MDGKITISWIFGGLAKKLNIISSIIVIKIHLDEAIILHRTEGFKPGSKIKVLQIVDFQDLFGPTDSLLVKSLAKVYENSFLKIEFT